MKGRRSFQKYVESLGHETHEWLLALYVYEHLQLLSVETIGKGGIDSCRVPFRWIVGRAIQVRASGYFLVHNHPSGDPRPSDSDKKITMRLARLSSELNIPLLDHMIVAGNQMTSSSGYF